MPAPGQVFYGKTHHCIISIGYSYDPGVQRDPHPSTPGYPVPSTAHGEQRQRRRWRHAGAGSATVTHCRVPLYAFQLSFRQADLLRIASSIDLADIMEQAAASLVKLLTAKLMIADHQACSATRQGGALRGSFEQS